MATRLDTLLAKATPLDGIGGQPHQLANMIYGDPGSGKTILNMKLAQKIRDGGKILFLDSLEGYVSLEPEGDGSDPWKPLRAGAARFRVDDPKDLVVWANGLRRNVPKLKPVSVVVLDEFSMWVKRIAESYVRDLHGTDPEDMMPVIEGHDWGPIGAAAMSILTAFMESGRHILVVSHSRLRGGDDDNGGKGGKFSPNFTPLLNTDIQGMLHQTTLLTTRLAGRGQYERTLHTRPSASITARSRVGGMPMNPTEKQYLDLTAGWTLGTVPTAPAKSAARAVKDEEPAEAPLEDSPNEGDEGLDIDDQPVIVDEPETK